MDFFDKITDAVMDTVKTVGDKAKEVTDVTKLKIDIKNQEDLINKKYQELGEKYFEAHKDEADNADSDIFDEIKAAIAERDRLCDNMLDATGAAVCPECGAKVTAGAKFCSNCGAAFEEEAEKVDAEVVEDESK